MTDREKVSRGLACCLSAWRHCDKCTYKPPRCAELLTDAMALLEAPETRVMTLEEVKMNEVYWVEDVIISRPWPIAMHHIRNKGLLDGPVYQDYMGDNFNAKEYGKKWRCWTSRPTDEQREATPWRTT